MSAIDAGIIVFAIYFVISTAGGTPAGSGGSFLGGVAGAG